MTDPMHDFSQAVSIARLLLSESEETKEVVSYFRANLEEVDREIEKIRMKRFKVRNRFEADNDMAKRVLIQMICVECDVPPPQTDEERNALLEIDATEDTEMMMIGWRKKY